MNTSSIARVKETFEQWAMYDAVVRHDYMHHAELVTTLAAWAAARKEPLRIVDLGCGDAWLATHAFRDANVDEYLGVDVSQAAAERAMAGAKCWPGRAKVACGNLAEIVRDVADESVNTVLASFSLHHFASEQKIAILQDCARIVSPGGVLIWIDAVRGENQTRDEWVRQLADVMQSEWIGLTEQQRASACAHVLEADFPETARRMREMTASAGFDQAESLLRQEFFSGWAFMKA